MSDSSWGPLDVGIQEVTKLVRQSFRRQHKLTQHPLQHEANPTQKKKEEKKGGGGGWWGVVSHSVVVLPESVISQQSLISRHAAPQPDR